MFNTIFIAPVETFGSTGVFITLGGDQIEFSDDTADFFFVEMFDQFLDGVGMMSTSIYLRERCLSLI